MPLVNCPECSRQISTAADACPQCGYPMQARVPVPSGPQCYSCSAEATTRCQSCGTMSCVQHLQNIYVSHGRGGANELRCESCFSSAQSWQIFGWIIGGIGIIIMLVVWFIWSQMGRR